jgi:signal transduction histidine kinase
MDLMYHFALPFMGFGIVTFSVVLLFVFGVSAYATLKFALKPLQEISDSAAAISTRALHARLDTKSVPSEIAPLVDSFNRVLGRLEHGFRVQQDFLATAAHELKTPLALIRAQIELMEASDHRGAVLNDVEQMARQVQQLLLLAEASEIHSYRFAVVDVHETVMEAARFLQRAAEAADVTLVTPEYASGPPCLADRGALFTLLKNVLENAIEHAPRGSEVQVDIHDATVSVRDWGPGVSEEQLPHLFSRFWRGAHRRDQGAGLGLAICQEVALAHGWTLTAHREDPGLRVCLSRPRPSK